MSDTDRRSPYIVLGVDYGVSVDTARRAFARKVRAIKAMPNAPFSMEDLTWALHVVEQDGTAASSLVDYFRVPANRATAATVDEGLLFTPEPEPLARATEPPTEAQLENLRRAALRQCVTSILQWSQPSRRRDPYTHAPEDKTCARPQPND